MLCCHLGSKRNILIVPMETGMFREKKTILPTSYVLLTWSLLSSVMLSNAFTRKHFRHASPSLNKLSFTNGTQVFGRRRKGKKRKIYLETPFQFSFTCPDLLLRIIIISWYLMTYDILKRSAYVLSDWGQIQYNTIQKRFAQTAGFRSCQCLLSLLLLLAKPKCS